MKTKIITVGQVQHYLMIASNKALKFVQYQNYVKKEQGQLMAFREKHQRWLEMPMEYQIWYYGVIIPFLLIGFYQAKLIAPIIGVTFLEHSGFHPFWQDLVAFMPGFMLLALSMTAGAHFEAIRFERDEETHELVWNKQKLVIGLSLALLYVALLTLLALIAYEIRSEQTMFELLIPALGLGELVISLFAIKGLSLLRVKLVENRYNSLIKSLVKNLYRYAQAAAVNYHYYQQKLIVYNKTANLVLETESPNPNLKVAILFYNGHNDEGDLEGDNTVPPMELINDQLNGMRIVQQ